MHLAIDLSFSHTEGRWALPGSWVGRDFPDVRMYMELAQTAERGGIDLLFFGDGTGIPSTWRGSIAPAVEWGVQWPRHDMSPVIRSEEHTSELQSLMRISYAVFSLKKNNTITTA